MLLTVSGSTFDHNLALGGNYNTATSGRGAGENIGSGGAIQIGEWVSPDGHSHSITDSTFTHNQAIGGKGMAGENGGDAGGGALLVNAINSTVNVTVSHCTIDHNDAIGGPGGIGGNGGNGEGGNGGEGWGGGIASEGTSDAVLTEEGGTALATLNVSNTTVDHNKAQGGDGVVGGNGYGGGLYIYNGEESTFTLTDVTVQFNFAIGGSGSGGTDGAGVGGGVYTIGTFSPDPTTVIKKNHASTSNDDIFS